MLLVWVNLFCVTGVAQVLNRLDGKPFDDADQRLFEVLQLLVYFFFSISNSLNILETMGVSLFYPFRHL